MRRVILVVIRSSLVAIAAAAVSAPTVVHAAFRWTNRDVPTIGTNDPTAQPTEYALTDFLIQETLFVAVMTALILLVSRRLRTDITPIIALLLAIGGGVCADAIFYGEYGRSAIAMIVTIVGVRIIRTLRDQRTATSSIHGDGRRTRGASSEVRS